MSQDDKSNVQRIAAILKGFDARNTPRRTHDILEDLGVTRSTGFGLLRAMVATGWLERFDHGFLRLGPKSRQMLFAALEVPEPSEVKKLSARPGGQGFGAQGNIPDLEWDPTLVRTVDASQYQRAAPYRIGFSNASTSNAWRRAMLQSLFYAERIAQSQIEALIVLDAEDDPALQLAQIDELVGQGIDLLLISITSVNDKALSDRLGELAAEGLPIVAIDRRPNDRSSLVSFVTASDSRIGRISALWMAETLSGQGRVWMLSGLDGASPALRRQQAALAVFSEFPGIRVENVSYTDWTEAGGYDAIDKVLAEARRPPDGVWCDSGLQGVGSVKRFLDGDFDIPAHTGGDLNEMYKLCLHHKAPMAALDYPASMGARALGLALDILAGSTVPQRVEEPVQIVLPRGLETPSVKADSWAELHVAWDLPDDAILSQGPALRPEKRSIKGSATA
ncbi:substrate-binding domain-containing protein [Ruegeria sp. HKCCD4884]|uniref:substrate-binding domain-containing protein n=1 Tax=Ruegeria sp. HKCCD4884 TaxID=2683022 RepID=UPI0014911C13|nr:substrate-binding domain-containing protein [Ruegeria sp. HKCCD4884]NOD92382.1 substrate-binding domain-containing protein [Ruegeria sp. HKCCD4884]